MIKITHRCFWSSLRNGFFLAILLLISSLSFAENYELSAQNYSELWTYIDQQLTDLHIREFYLEVQNNSTPSLYYQLTQSAKKKDYIIYENYDETIPKLMIYVDQKKTEIVKNQYLFTRITTKEFPLYRIMLVKDRQVILSEEISFENSAFEKRNSKAKWFDPIILTAVVGSLIYLIYYGNH